MDKKEHKTFKVLHYMCIGTVLLSEWEKESGRKVVKWMLVERSPHFSISKAYFMRGRSTLLWMSLNINDVFSTEKCCSTLSLHVTHLENHCFPQTSFYFVVWCDWVVLLSHRHLDSSCQSTPTPTCIQRLAKLPSPGWLTADMYWTKVFFMSAPQEESERTVFVCIDSLVLFSSPL